jgi:hypothetical protein
LQLLRILFHELIVHETEKLITDNSTRELMCGVVESQQGNKVNEFLDSLGPDFLSKINLVSAPAAAAGSPSTANKMNTTSQASVLHMNTNVKEEINQLPQI